MTKVKQDAKKKKKVVLAVEEVPEVAEYLQAQQDVEEYIAANQEWFDELRRLVELRNEKLEQAEKAVRPLGASCGPFQLHSETVRINAEKLYEWLGKDDFGSAGGYTETVVTYKVDRTRFLAHVARGDLPQEIVESVVSTSVSYKKPAPYTLP